MKRKEFSAKVRERDVPINIQVTVEELASGANKITKVLTGRGRDLAKIVGLTSPIFVPDFVEVRQIWVAGYLAEEKIRGWGTYRAKQDGYHRAHFERELIMPETSMDEWLKRVLLIAGAIKRLARSGKAPKGAYAAGSHGLDPYGNTPIKDGDQIVGIIADYHKNPLPEREKNVVVDAVLYRADPDNPYEPKHFDGLKTWDMPVIRSLFEAVAPGLLALNKPETGESSEE